MTDTLRICTRGSKLALWQAEWVKDQLETLYPQLKVELVLLKTKGDKILDVPLSKVGGKGLFTKELEIAMLEGSADLAVHSMKDVPTEFPEGLMLGPLLRRGDPRDAVLSVNYKSLMSLPKGAVVGSSSLRRQSQILNVRPDLKITFLRGNVGTRIQKMVDGQYDAIILAAAGVKRLKTMEHVVELLDPEHMLPAIGQGAVGLEHRSNDTRMIKLLEPLRDPDTQVCVTAERAFLATLEGGCQVPIAAHAVLQGETLHMEGLVASVDGVELFRLKKEGSAKEPEQLGRELAKAVGEMGGSRILKEVYALNQSGS